MTRFLIGVAVLQVLLYVVVLRPLWPRNRGLTVILLAVLPLTSMLLYRQLGAPAALDPKMAQAPHTMNDAVSQLEAALQRDPQQPEGWLLLSRAYAEMQKPEKARDAAVRAAELAPDNVDALVQAAQMQAAASATHLFEETSIAKLRRALELEPKHQQARFYLGVALRQSGQAKAAADIWETLLTDVEPGPAKALRPQIDAARADAGLPPLPSSADAPASGPAAASSSVTAPATAATATTAPLAVKVALDPGLASRVRGDTTVFVIARAVNGPPMPVAVEKRSVRELPLTASLDDGDSAMPTLRLSEMQEVEVLARLSESGIANKQQGDIETTPLRVKLPATAPIELVLGKDR